MNPTALDDRDAPGQPKRALPWRIIRKPQTGAGHAPTWTADTVNLIPDATVMSGASNGAHPQADSLGGYSGYAGYPPSGPNDSSPWRPPQP